YVLGSKHLGDAGLHPAPAESPEAAARLRNRALTVGLVFLAVVAVLGIGAYTGSIPVTAKQIADDAGGAQADLRDRRLLSRRGALLVGVRAGGLLVESVRRPQHPQRGPRVQLS